MPSQASHAEASFNIFSFPGFDGIRRPIPIYIHDPEGAGRGVESRIQDHGGEIVTSHSKAHVIIVLRNRDDANPLIAKNDLEEGLLTLPQVSVVSEDWLYECGYNGMAGIDPYLITSQHPPAVPVVNNVDRKPVVVTTPIDFADSEDEIEKGAERQEEGGDDDEEIDADKEDDEDREDDEDQENVEHEEEEGSSESYGKSIAKTKNKRARKSKAEYLSCEEREDQFCLLIEVWNKDDHYHSLRSYLAHDCHGLFDYCRWHRFFFHAIDRDSILEALRARGLELVLQSGRWRKKSL